MSRLRAPGHGQCPHRPRNRERIKDPEVGQPGLGTSPHPTAADLIPKGCVSVCSGGGHRAVGNQEKHGTVAPWWKSTGLPAGAAPRDPWGAVRSRGPPARAPLSQRQGARLPPPASSSSSRSPPPSLPLRNSSSTCPTGWSTPSAYGPIWPRLPPPQPPLLLKA